MFYDNMRTLQNFNELTWPQAQQIIINRPTFPDPLRASRAIRSSRPRRRTSPSMSNDDGEPVRAPVQRRRQPHRDCDSSRSPPTGQLINRYSDRDTVDPNLPDQTTQGEAVSAVRARELLAVDRATTPTGAAGQGREAHVASLSVPRCPTRFSTAKDQNFANSSATATASSRSTATAWPIAAIVSWPAASSQLPAQAQVSAIGDFRSSLPFSPTSSLRSE